MGQYKVPQNVEAEDKIIGPLTLKQFIYAVIGIAWAGLCFLIFHTIPVIMVVLALPFTILFLLLAFYQRDGQNFEQFLVAIVGYFSQSRQRLWRKEDVIDSFKIEPKKVTAEMTQRNPNEVRSQLERLATVVDARGWAEHPENSAHLMPTDKQALPSEEDRLIRPVVTSPNKTLIEPEVDDVFDLQRSPLAQNLGNLLSQANTDMKSEAIEAMRQKVSAPKPAATAPTPPPVQPVAPVAPATPVAPVVASPTVAPVTPAAVPLIPNAVPLVPSDEVMVGQNGQVTPSNISVTRPVSSDILKLATESDDLTVSQLANQASRVGALPEGQAVSLSNGASTNPTQGQV